MTFPMGSKPTVDRTKCPVCGKDGRIQKVSAIYAVGTSSGIFAGPSVGGALPIGSGDPSLLAGYSQLSGTQQTLLSRKLAPPPRPASGPSFGAVLFLTGLFLVAFSVLLIGMNDIFRVFGVFVLVLGAGVLVVWWIVARARSPGPKRDMVAFERRMARWNRLYYCARDDCVFDPESGLHCPADQMNGLVYP
jgi:hypothetical protein